MKLKKFEWVLIGILVCASLLAIYQFFLPPERSYIQETVPVSITVAVNEIENKQMADYLEKFKGEVSLEKARREKARIEKVTIMPEQITAPNLETGEMVIQDKPNAWKAMIEINAQAIETEKGFYVDSEYITIGNEKALAGKGLSVKATIVSIEKLSEEKEIETKKDEKVEAIEQTIVFDKIHPDIGEKAEGLNGTEMFLDASWTIDSLGEVISIKRQLGRAWNAKSNGEVVLSQNPNCNMVVVTLRLEKVKDDGEDLCTENGFRIGVGQKIKATGNGFGGEGLIVDIKGVE